MKAPGLHKKRQTGYLSKYYMSFSARKGILTTFHFKNIIFSARNLSALSFRKCFRVLTKCN